MPATRLLLVTEIWDGKPSHRKSLARNLLVWSDLTFGPLLQGQMRTAKLKSAYNSLSVPQGTPSNHRLSPLWVRVPQVAILRTCPNMTLAVERDVKPQLWPARDACLCMGELQAPPAPAAPHFVFLITL